MLPEFRPDADGRLDTHAQALREQLVEHGAVVLRNVVRPEELEPLRRTVELLGAACARGRQPQGRPEAVAQWRFDLSTPPHATADTLNGVAFALGHNTLGVSHVLLGGDPARPGVSASEAATVGDADAVKTTLCGDLGVLCSGEVQHGATDFHRDIDSREMAPLSALQGDLVANLPGSVQWNVSLAWLRAVCRLLPCSLSIGCSTGGAF